MRRKILLLSMLLLVLVVHGCSNGGGGGGQVPGAGGGVPLGEVPVSVVGTISGGNNAGGGAPDRLDAPLVGYTVRAKNAKSGDTLAGAETLTDNNGNFILSFKIPVNQDVAIVVVAQDPQDATGATIMRSILPMSTSEIQSLINQYQGKPVLTIGMIDPTSEQLVKSVEQDLGLSPGTLGKVPIANTPTQINTEANKGNRFVLMGVTVVVQGKVTDGIGTGPVLPMSSLSTSSAGIQANSNNNNAFLNADGSLLVFDSAATNLVAGDTNNAEDVFVKNTKTGETRRVSVASNGTQGDNDSNYAVISENGKYIVFESMATNLVTGDTNGFTDLFVHDLITGKTVRISVASDGTEANNDSFGASISADGRVVAFCSLASNLVASDTNNTYDIFVHDRDADGNGVFDEPGGISTSRISISSAGVQADDLSLSAAISANGRYVAFDSDATNLVANDTNDSSDVFVRDLQIGQTIRVSMTFGGAESDDNSYFPSISDDGRFIAFESEATNLVAGDTNDFADIFVRDRDSDRNGVFDEAGKVTITRVSVAMAGAQADEESYIGTTGFGGNGGISGDGRVIVFLSDATNLVPGDTNNATDIFIHDRTKGTTEMISKSAAGSLANDDCNQAAISKNGKVIAFSSTATNLVSSDANASDDIFAISIP